ADHARPIGIEALAGAIFSRVIGQGITSGDFAVAINARHQACLATAERFAEAARQAFKAGLSPEFIALEVRAALDAVGDVVGRVDTEDLLGSIFSKFCLGK
ncbi:MAG: tRNA uridine-5-carboxymethylaminomethyl(34) synthesis GTPase MnmE, partial [Verrucomicrobiota bacterium]